MKDRNLLPVQITAVTRLLWGITLLFAVTYVGSQIAKYFFGHPYLMGMTRAFDLDAELNLPAYYSQLLLIFAAQLLLFVSMLTRIAGGRNVSKWRVLCIGFLLMGFDEGYSVHEQLSRWLHDRIHGQDKGMFHYTWVMPALMLVALLAVFFFRFLRDLPAVTRRRFVLAGAVYIGCAVGVEMIEGWYVEWRHLPDGVRDFRYSLMVLVEECGEMGGVVLFIRSLLLYCARYHPELSFRLRRAERD